MLASPTLSQVFVFCRKWFPGREIDIPCMAEAVFLERDYWERMTIAVTNGIGKALTGK